MRCEHWREILSAQLDGEAGSEERAEAAWHLDACSDCRRWQKQAMVVTRRARIQVLRSLPDLSEDVVVAVARHSPYPKQGAKLARVRAMAVLRVALGVLGAVQGILGFAQVGWSEAGQVHVSGQHVWHESAAWNVAVGAGFVFVALRRQPPAGILPMLSVFVAALVLLSVNDLVMSQVAVQRLVSHVFLLAGYAITVLLSRLARRPDGSPVRRRHLGSGWRFRPDEVDEPLAPLRLVPSPPSPQQADGRAGVRRGNSPPAGRAVTIRFRIGGVHDRLRVEERCSFPSLAGAGTGQSRDRLGASWCVRGG